MNNIKAHVPRFHLTHDGIEVCTIIIDQPSCIVHNIRNLSYVLLKDTNRIGVREHETGGPWSSSLL